MSNSQHDQTSHPTCLSALLRRVLCSGSLPTHPSDHLTTTSDSTHQEKLIVPSKTINISQQNHLQNPNIVARLMGLDSLPDPSITTRRRRSLDSFLRSKSVNYVDLLPHFDEASKHRRVRTSVSFREVPKSLNDRDREFFVLCFDGVDRKARKPESSFRLKREHNVVTTDSKKNVSNQIREKSVAKKREKSTIKRNEVSSNALMIKPSSPKVLGDEERNLCRKSNVNNSKKVSGKEKIEMKTSLRLERRKERRNRVHMKKDLSIVPINQNSVMVEDTAATVSDENSRGVSLTSRKKPSSRSNIQKYDDPCPKLVSRLHIKRDDDEQGQNLDNSSNAYKKPQKRTTCDYANVLKQACSVTEDHIKGYVWFADENVLSFENYEEICAVVGRRIFDALLHQLVEELCSSLEC